MRNYKLIFIWLFTVLNSFGQRDTSLKIETQLDNPFLCPDKQEAYLYIDLKSSPVGKRVPLNICVVFDRSGSMEGDRIYYGKKAIEYLIDQLQPQDNLAIVIYDHEATILHGSEPVTNKEELKKKLEHIRARGATNLSAGLELGYQEVISTYDRNKINRVLLFSDGHPNEGITDPFYLDRMASNYARRDDVSISTFGVGHEYNEYLLHDIAESGAGNYYYIQKSTDITTDFSNEISLLHAVTAQHAVLTIKYPTENFTLNQVYGHPNHIVNNQITIDMKEIHPNEANGILIKFLVKKPITAPATFTTYLSYFSPSLNSNFSIERTNILSPNTIGEDCSTKYNEAVLDKMIYYTSHYLMESAVKDVENNNIPSAKKKLEQGKNMINASSSSKPSPMLQEQYQAMTDYETNLNNWNSKSEQHKKHIQKNAHYSNYKIRKQRKG